jgi:hypothetical protein
MARAAKATAAEAAAADPVDPAAMEVEVRVAAEVVVVEGRAVVRVAVAKEAAREVAEMDPAKPPPPRLAPRRARREAEAEVASMRPNRPKPNRTD